MSSRPWLPCVVFAISGALVAHANLDFVPWEPFGPGEAVGESTSFLADGNVVLIGGYTSPNIPTAQSVSISATRSINWGRFPLMLPFPVGGIFSTVANDYVYVSVMSTNNFTLGDGSVGDASKPDIYSINYVDSSANWTKGELDTTISPQRRRAGMLSHYQWVFFVGGVDAVTKEYIPNILAFDTDKNTWSIIHTLTETKSSVCDCVGHILKPCFTTLMCRNCETDVEMELLVFNPCIGKLETMITEMAPNNSVSIASTTLGHYVVALITLPDEDPTVLYLDMFQNQLNLLSGTGGFRKRHHGTMFTLSNAVYYAGGYDPVTNETSSFVDYAIAVPSQYATVDRDDRTYSVGEPIIITTETCQSGTTVLLSSCPSCLTAVTKTAPCIRNNQSSSGVVTLIPESPAPVAYVCMSNGICTQDKTKRKPCPADNFETCKNNNCCWDNGDRSCFLFIEGDTNNMFFDVVSPIVPISIEAAIPTPTSTPFLDFIKSPGGIILLTILGLAIVLGAVAAIWFLVVPKMSGDESDDDEDGHPLDQYGKYKLVKKLGQGGFGQVFLVKRKRDDLLLALKYIITPDETERNYAVKEFEMLHGAQGHPNMVHLEEMLINWSIDNGPEANIQTPPTKAVAVVDDKKANKSSKKGEHVPLLQFAPRYVCIIMEYCPEGDLSSHILASMDAKGKRGLPEAMILNVVCAQICELLIHLHDRSPPIVHRDMKPENILLKNNATQVVVTDFGLAQQLEKSYMTTRAGSLHYVAPECWKKKYTATVDMWALGCILYGCCTGRVTAKTARVMFSDARNRSFSREVSAELSNYSSLMRSVILGLLRPDPATRLTARQVLEMLKQDPKKQN